MIPISNVLRYLKIIIYVLSTFSILTTSLLICNKCFKKLIPSYHCPVNIKFCQPNRTPNIYQFTWTVPLNLTEHSNCYFAIVISRRNSNSGQISQDICDKIPNKCSVLFGKFTQNCSAEPNCSSDTASQTYWFVR